MLARLSARSARLFDIQFEPTDFSVADEDESLLLDIDALGRFVQPLPAISWRDVAGMCGRTITPVYKSLQTMLSDDAERIALILSELEPLSYDDLIDDENFGRAKMPPPPPCSQKTSSRQCNNDSYEGTSSHEKSRRRRRSTSPIDHPLIIPSTHHTLPMIIVTPCLSQSCDNVSRPPVQDSSFGNRLVLPKSYPVFNDVFPPLLPALYPPFPAVEKWRWVDGHWWAVVPTLEEQKKQGLFSRPLVVKRRTGGCHPCRVGFVQCDTSPKPC